MHQVVSYLLVDFHCFRFCFYVVSVALGGVKMVSDGFWNLLILQVEFMLCVSLIDTLNAFKLFLVLV